MLTPTIHFLPYLKIDVDHFVYNFEKFQTPIFFYFYLGETNFLVRKMRKKKSKYIKAYKKTPKKGGTTKEMDSNPKASSGR